MAGAVAFVVAIQCEVPIVRHHAPTILENTNVTPEISGVEKR